jgi:hypothetical protein
MTKLNHNDSMAYVRKCAKNVGLTFKKDNTATINGVAAYKFIDRNSGLVVGCNYTLSSAFEDCCSGYIESYNTDFGEFFGIFNGIGE